MLKGKQKNLDKNKDGKITGEDFKMMKAKYGKMVHKKGLGGLLSGLAKKVFGKKSDTAMPSTPVQVAMENGKIPLAKLYKQVAQKTTGAKYGKMMKAKTGKDVDIDLMEKIAQQSLIGKGAMKTKVKKRSMGGEMKSTQGYGAARTSGMGLQDEDLIPGKSMDYYKDLM